MIKIEISGGNAEEISTHISSLANLLSGTAVPAVARVTLEPEAKPTRRSRKTEQAVEQKPETVAEDTTVEEEPALVETVVEEASATVEEADVAESSDEAVTEASETVGTATSGASENLDAFKAMDTTKAREWIISNYLNACFSDQAERTAKFREIVQHFNYGSLTAVPAEKLVDVLLYVEGKIKELGK